MASSSVAKVSPRIRFWIAVPITVVALLASLFLLPHLLPTGWYTILFVPLTFLVGLAWLLSSHARYSGGWRSLTLARAGLVSAGFAVAVLPLALLAAGAMTFGRLGS